MAYIDNSETARELDEAIRGNANTNLAPKNIAPQVVPVIDINPKNYKYVNFSATGSNVVGETLTTLRSDKDFYLTSSLLSMVSVSAGANIYRILVTLDGQSTQTCINSINHFNDATITSQAGNNPMSFNIPLKLLRGSTIVAERVGSLSSARASIFGYYQG